MSKMENRFSQLVAKNLSKKQCIDSGMALVLIFLLIGFFSKEIIYYQIAIPVLLINMIVPKFYYPFAIIWFSLSNILGMFMSSIILTLIFIIFVLPVSLIRRLFGKDTLLLKEFNKTRESIMKVRDHTFTKEDFEKPF